MLFRRRFALPLGLLLMLTVLPGPLAAQRFELTPYISSYVPFADVIADASGSARQEVGVGVGARFTAWGSGRLSAEIAGTYVETDLEITPTAGGSVILGGHLLLAAAKAVYAWHPPERERTTRLFVSAGVGLVQRGGEFFGDLDGTLDPAGVVGASVRIQLSPGFIFRADVEDFLYSAQFSDASGQSDSRFQSDLHVSLGLAIPIGR